MRLRIFSVVGEALNFGLRRLATIFGASWLAIVLLLIVNMVTVFAFLSVIAGRVITFEDMGTFFNAQTALSLLLAAGWQKSPDQMWAITIANLSAQSLLTASFMAPLIRYAGLGEKPHGAIAHLPFGADQIRYIVAGLFSFLFVVILILAPIAGATYYILKYIFDALSKTVASFPNPESLHTVDFITSGEALAKSGSAYFNLGLPLLAAAPFLFLLWLVIYWHFHPRNRPNAPAQGNQGLRALVTLIVAVLAVAGAYFFMRSEIISLYQTAAAANKDIAQLLSKTPINVHLLIGAVLVLLLGYVNLRLYPYPGVAVCRKSMGFGNMLRLTRGWNLIYLQIVLILVSIFIFTVQTLILNNLLLGSLVPMVLSLLYSATAVSTKLINSGATAEWVAPTFTWIWNGIKILVNILGVMFNFGVLAGLYGRLYRDSE